MDRTTGVISESVNIPTYRCERCGRRGITIDDERCPGCKRYIVWGEPLCDPEHAEADMLEYRMSER